MDEQTLIATLDKATTDAKESASALSKTIEDSRSALDKVVGEFKEAIPKATYKVLPDGAEKPADVLGKVEERTGVLAGLVKTEVLGIPIGAVAIGTAGGVFISELVDGFMATQGTMAKGAVKLAMAGVTATWGKRWIGKDAAYAIAFVLGIFGLSQIIPIDKYAAQAAGYIKGMLPGTIKVTGMPNTGGGALAQAQRVATDYYGKLGGAR